MTGRRRRTRVTPEDGWSAEAARTASAVDLEADLRIERRLPWKELGAVGAVALVVVVHLLA